MKKGIFRILKISLPSAALLGLVVVLVNPGEKPFMGWLGATLLSFLFVFGILFAFERLHSPSQVKRITVVNFLLRVATGIALFLMLPIWGYEEEPPQAGYLYLDAYRRDADAWQIASSDEALFAGFQDEFYTDQYGGMLSLSASVYRLLSPDAHRPLLILILTSFISALGLPFFWKAVSSRWGEKTANASAWIYALYPESIILGASQMREPILIGLSAIAFWGVLRWREDRQSSIIALALSGLFMVFISIKAAAAIALVVSVWFWLENLLPGMNRTWRLVSLAALILAVIVGSYLSWGWLVDSSRWDLMLMEGSSGRIQWEVELIGERFRAPFIIGYGLAQPVLPAAIVYPGLPITRSIAIFRSLGWYLLAPLLFSGFLLVWKKQLKFDRRVLLLFFLIVLVWTFISSARAGGDQWDNPRYRAIFLVWMAFLGGWSWVNTLDQRSPWLWRILLLEAIYIGFFIQWYLSRYYALFKRMDFWPMVRLLGGIGALIIFGGIIFDLIYNKIRKVNKENG